MAITYVGAGASNAALSGNLTLALPAGTQKDDILVADVGLHGSDVLSCSGYTKKAEYSAGGAGMNLVVPLEMLAYGIRSVAATQTTFNRSKIAMNAADYDGATYYFELVVTTATTTTYNVELYDVTNAAVKATIAMGTTAISYTRLRSTAFTPAAGNNVYAVRIDGTTSNSDVLVFTARIVIVQAAATKTRLQFPLVAHQYSGTQVDSNAGATDSITGNVYGQTTTTRYALWQKDAAKLATIAAGTPWTFEALVSLGTGTDTAYCELSRYTISSSTQVCELTHTGDTTITRVAADFANDAGGFTDLDEYEVRIKCNHATRYAYVYSANLYVKLTTLTKAQVYTRIGRHYTGTAGDTLAFQRITYDSAQWSSGTTWYLEATGVDATTVPLEFAGLRSDTDDSGLGTTTLATKLTMTGTRSRQRSPAITLTDELRYMGRASASVGTASFASEFLIAEVAHDGLSETQVTRFWKRHDGTESSPVITGASDAIAGQVQAWRGVHRLAVPNPILELHAARAAGGTGPGINSPLTTTWVDTAGANDGTLVNFTGSPWTGTGTAADPYRLVFAGDDDRVTVPHAAGLVFGSDFTVELWTKSLVAVGGWFWMAYKGTADTPNYGVEVMIAAQQTSGSSGQLRACVGPWFTDATTYSTVYDWSLSHHVVLTRVGGYCHLYVDGVEDDTGLANTQDLSTVTGRWNIGNGPHDTTTPLSGALAFVRQYDVGLTATQVAQNYEAGPSWLAGVTSDDPWCVYDAGAATASASSVTFPALTTPVDDAMAVGAAATATNNAYDSASVTFGNLTTPRGSTYAGTILGSDCSEFSLYGEQATAGSIGAPAGLQTTLGPKLWVSTIGALAPGPGPTAFHLTIDCQVVSEANLVPDPVIISLSPVEGIVGSSLAITGSDFGTEGVVKFGTTVATQTSYADSYIVVTVPSMSTGAKTVTVTPTSRVASNGMTYTILAAPVALGPVETNPLLDGNLTITIGGLDVSSAVLPPRSWSTTNPGGFGDASFRLPATDPGGPYEPTGAVVKGAAVIIAHSGTTLYQGEVTNDLTHATIENGTAFYEVTCAGLWWKANQRRDYCHVFADDDFDQWFTRQPAQSFAVSTDGELEIRLEKGQDAKANSGASLYYWLDSGLGDTTNGAGANVINAFVFLVQVDVGAANWYADISSATTPWNTWTADQSWNNTTVAAGTAYRVVASTAYSRALRIRLYSNADVAAVSADRFIRITRMSVQVDYDVELTISANTLANPTVATTTANHLLKTGDRVYITGSNSTPTINGWRTITYVDADSFSVPVNVTVAGTAGSVLGPTRVDSAMAAIATSTGLADTSVLQTGGVGYLNWGLNVRPFASRAEAIEMLAAASPDPLDYGFWDSAAFHCRTRPGAVTAENSYGIDAENTPGIDLSIFADAEGTPTHVKVLYKFRDVDGGSSVYPDGTIRSVYRPEEPDWTDATVVLDVWDQWADMSLETAQAEDIGDQILAWLANNRYRGTITIATPTVDLADGTATKNTAYIRGGDYIEDANLSTGPLMITGAFVDADSGRAELSIGETREDFVARINQMPGPNRAGKVHMSEFTRHG